MEATVVLIFAVTLCIINAAVWTWFSGMPLMGAAWCGAAAGCIWLKNWSTGG